MNLSGNIILGSTHSRAVHIDEEGTARTAKAIMTFGRLRANVCERNRISRLDTKQKVFKAGTANPIFMHVRRGQYTNAIKHFQFSYLRKKLQDNIPDTDVLKKARMQSEHILFNLAKLRWTGHVMSDCQRKFSMVNLRKENALKLAKRNATKIPLKPH